MSGTNAQDAVPPQHKLKLAKPAVSAGARGSRNLAVGMSSPQHLDLLSLKTAALILRYLSLH